MAGTKKKSRSVNKKKIEINDEFKCALSIMEKSTSNVFITGKAGTGKSTLLSYFRDKTKKRVAVLAPTGVGAVNVKGQTIHSFFHFKPDITPDAVRKAYKDDNPKNIYKKIDAIIIDEVSMVRADLLDCVDRFLKINGPDSQKPFGGLQMIFIGDLYQLPPVVTSDERKVFSSLYKSPYFFDAKVFADFAMEFVELEKIYRQQDEEFINILNSIRNNSITDRQIEELNRRCNPCFKPNKDEFFIYLTTTNKMADEVNAKELSNLTGKAFSFNGIIDGHFGKEYLPTTVKLNLKEGAQVMLLNNDPFGHWINGTLGEIKKIHKSLKDDEEDFLEILLSGGRTVELTRHAWEIFRFNVVGNKLLPEVVGSFTQFPLRLAWAVTIHKSQGKTFQRTIIDMGRGSFAHGQTYVALSRCTKLDGIILKKPFKKSHILMDWRVVKFLTRYQYRKAEEKIPLEKKVRIIKSAIKKKKAIKITYLKTSDEKSRRIVKPYFIGSLEFKDKEFLGMKAFCTKRGKERVFRIDRILKLEKDPH